MTAPFYNIELNSEQKKAAHHINGPLLVIAGAGSGKTRVVTERILHLIDSGIDPENILAVTFTNKAAGEMRSRILEKKMTSMLICTFHSLGVRILRESISFLGYDKNFIIYDADDSEKLIKLCIKSLPKQEKCFDVKVFKNLISHYKNQFVFPENLSVHSGDSPIELALPDVYKMYVEKLKEFNAVDFDDLLALSVKVIKENPIVLKKYQQRWKYLLIDEYQDTNYVQYLLAKHLVQDSHNIFVVGDPDQSIYSWRGANIKNIMNFEKDFPGATIIRLEENYRSQSNILEAANSLIKFNYNRYEKDLWSRLGPGEKIHFFAAEDDRQEASFVAEEVLFLKNQNLSFNQIVIFYRTNFQSRTIEDAFLRKKIPYHIIGGISFYQRKEIKDILAFLKLVETNKDFISLERVLNIPKRGIGEATIKKIVTASSALKIPILDFLKKNVNNELPSKDLVKLTERQQQNIKEFLSILDSLKKASLETSLHELVRLTIQKTHYMDYLKEDPETLEDRKENLNELITKAAEWESIYEEKPLSLFLEELSLKSSLDESSDSTEKVSLMTFHNGKGLEFHTAFLVGMEEDLFPHINSKDSLEEIEEERRLCYVGMTRAKNKLYITGSKYRYLWGSWRSMRPSRFIQEIPPEYIKKVF